MFDFAWKILAALAPLASLSRPLRQKAAEARTRVSAVEWEGVSDKRLFKIHAERIDASNLAGIKAFGIAVGRLDRHGRFVKRAVLCSKQAAEVAQARTWTDVDVSCRAVEADPAECVRAFVELVGDVIVFDREAPVRKQLPAAWKAKQQSLGGKPRRARSAFVPPIRL